jgi:hypothetical protein
MRRLNRVRKAVLTKTFTRTSTDGAISDLKTIPWWSPSKDIPMEHIELMIPGTMFFVKYCIEHELHSIYELGYVAGRPLKWQGGCNDSCTAYAHAGLPIIFLEHRRFDERYGAKIISVMHHVFLIGGTRTILFDAEDTIDWSHVIKMGEIL